MYDIAVLISVWAGDSHEFLGYALDSILSSDYPSDKIHVYFGVDGPVPDELEKSIKYYADKCHTIVWAEENIGLSRMLNRLIGCLGNERLIFRMDSDDISLPGRMREQINYMKAHPDIDALGGSIIEIDEEGREIFRRTYPSEPDVISRYIAKACPLAHPSVCFRGDFFQRFGKYSEHLRTNQDLELWFRALAQGARLTNIPEPLVAMRYSEDLLRRRHSWSRAWPEFKVYMVGIWRLHGVTWRYAYPLLRFVSRIGPVWLARRLYSGRIRRGLNNQ